MNLLGKRILVVEDDYYLARDLCDLLDECGATVLGPAPTPFYASQLLRRHLDGAVLDIRLHGTDVYELAGQLQRNDTPIIFATAIESDRIPVHLQSVPRIGKPYMAKDVVGLLSDVIGRHAMPKPRLEPAAQPGDLDAALMRAVVRAIQPMDA